MNAGLLLRDLDIGGLLWQTKQNIFIINYKTIVMTKINLFFPLIMACICSAYVPAEAQSSEPCPTPSWLGVRDITHDSAGFVAWATEHKILRLVAGSDTSLYDWGTSTSFAVAGLTPETEYTAEIRAVCAPGDSSGWGASTTFTTLDEPCPTPSWLGVRDITHDSAGFVAWATEHKILRLVAGSDTSLYDWGTSTSFAVAGLTPETEYTAEIRAVCAPGDSSGWGASTTFTTATQPIPCGIPTQLESRCDSLMARLTWIPGENNTGFQLICKEERQSRYDTLSTLEPLAILHDLSPNSTYLWTVRGLCQSDTSLFAETAEFETRTVSNQSHGLQGLRCIARDGKMLILNPAGIHIEEIQVFNSKGQCLLAQDLNQTGDIEISVPRKQILVTCIHTRNGQVVFRTFAL